MNQTTNTRRLTTMAIMISLSVVLVYFSRIIPPFFPAAPYLEYDPADIPILIVTFAYGPLAGFFVTIIASVVQGVTVSAHSGIYGILMHIFSTTSFAVTAGLIYRAKHNRIGAAIGLVCGIVVSAAVMVGANLIVTPIFTGAPISAVRAMLIPIIIPFNLIKAGINGAVTFLLYKRISGLIKGAKKEEVKDEQ